MKSEQLILLLGISQRSGTNYFYRLLEKHPDIVLSSHPSEDFIIHNSEYLVKHIKKTVSCWNNNWKGMDKDVFGEKYRKSIEQALLSYLEPLGTITEKERLLTKTPSVRGIENVFEIFPNCKLIILVRDGVNIISSGMHGFGWHFNDAVKAYKDNGKILIQFLEQHKDNDNVVLIRYEDLFSNTKNELISVFKKIGLDPSKYDYSEIENMPIYGSSFTSAKGEMVWKVEEKPSGFNPNARGENWRWNKKKYFKFYCQNIQKYFGYKTQ